jgi:hypothetical protein
MLEKAKEEFDNKSEELRLVNYVARNNTISARDAEIAKHQKEAELLRFKIAQANEEILR